VNTVFNAVVAMLEAKVKFDVQKMIRNSFLNIGTYSTTAPTPDYPKGGVANIEFKERTMEFKKIPMNK
jgi:hypothetical protein